MFDDIDLKLIDALQKRARTKRNELAQMMGLSIPAISERLRKLEESGTIRGYGAAIDYRALGYDVSAFIAVTVDSSRHYKNFLQRVQGEDEILECHAVTGKGTHLIKIRSRNTQSLEKLLSRIQSWDGVVQTLTSVILSSPKETTYIPVAGSQKTVVRRQ